jgi:hypothetical protein
LPSGKLADPTREAIIMAALTLDEQLTFDVAVALKKVKIPGFRKGVVEEGRFEIAKTIVEHLKASRWEFSKIPCNDGCRRLTLLLSLKPSSLTAR